MKSLSLVWLLLPNLLLAGPFRELPRGGKEVTPVPVEVSPEAFEYRAPMQGEVKVATPVLVSLPQEVITSSLAGYRDVRVFDDQGQVVPHVIYDQLVPERPSSNFQFEPRDLTEEGNVTSVILHRPNSRGPYDQLDIRTSERDFKKKVLISSSVDGKTWALAGQDLIYDYSSRLDLSKRRVKFQEVDTDWLRLDISDDVSSPVGQGEVGLEFLIFRIVARPGVLKFDGFTGICTDGRDKFLRFGERPVEVQPISRAKRTILDLGAISSPVAEVRLDVSTPFFLRKVEWWGARTLKPVGEDPEEGYQLLGSGDIYRVPGDSRTNSSIFPQLDHVLYLRLKIVNEDNPPLEIAGVKVVWIRQNLYFIATPGRSYQLHFGNPHVRAPVYEMARLLRLDPAELLDLPEFSLGTVEKNPAYNVERAVPDDTLKAKKRQEQLLLQGVVLILVAGMGVWVFRLLGRLSPPSSGDAP